MVATVVIANMLEYPVPEDLHTLKDTVEVVEVVDMEDLVGDQVLDIPADPATTDHLTLPSYSSPGPQLPQSATATTRVYPAAAQRT